MASFLSFLLFFLAFFHRPLEVHWTPDRADGGNRSTWLANHLQLIVGDGVEPRDAENLFVGNLFWKTTTLLQIVCVIFQDFALKWQAVALHVIFEEMQNCSLAGALGFPGALNGVLESLLLRYRCTFLISWFSYTWSYEHSPGLLHSFKGILCLTASLCFLFYELLCILHL